MYRLMRQTISKTPLMIAISATIGVNYWHKRHTKLNKQLMANIDTRRKLRLRIAHMKDTDKAIGDVYHKAWRKIVFLRSYKFTTPYKTVHVNEGMGVIITTDPTYVLTCAHCIDGDVSAFVPIYRFAKWKGEPDPELPFIESRYCVGYVAYMEREIDCALIRLIDDLPKRFVAEFSKHGVKSGQHLVGVGNRDINYCICDGVVNGVDRDCGSFSHGSYHSCEAIDDPTNRYIMHTNRTYPGFSGSAVFDMEGKVVGMHTGSIAPFNEGFAVPYNDLIKDFIERGIAFDGRHDNEMKVKEIEERHEVKGSLGICVRRLDQNAIDNRFGRKFRKLIPLFVGSLGIIVLDQVMANQIGDGENHLMRNDVITEVNGNEVNSVTMFRQLIDTTGDIVLSVHRFNANSDGYEGFETTFLFTVKPEPKSCLLI